MDNQLNIYLIEYQDEKYWITGFTAIQALIHFVDTESLTIWDFDITDDVSKLPKEEWGEWNIRYEEPEAFEISYLDYMKTAKPCEIFASSTFE